MSDNAKQHDIIPPDWISAIFSFLVGFAGIFAEFYFDDLSWKTRYIVAPLGIVICIVLFIKNSHSYALTDKKISCRIFGLSYRQIPWNNICQIGVSKRGPSSGVGGYAPFIILSLSGCPRFRPGVDYGGKYIGRHPFRTVVIQYSKRNVELLEKHYGPLDYFSPSRTYYSDI